MKRMEVPKPNAGEKVSAEELQERKFELKQTPEGREIREKIEREYDRRIAILRSVISALEIPEDAIILRPPVLDRTDLGYVADVDLILLGSAEERESLFKKIHKTFGVFPFVISINEARFKEIEKALPQLYQFLMSRKGRIPHGEAEIIESDFTDEAAELEMRSRGILTLEEKEILKKQRLKIASKFIEEVSQKVPVVAHALSGSMITHMEHFGINSDLDIDLITNPERGGEENANDWIHLYLTWKYAEECGVKVDVSDDTLSEAKKMASLLPGIAEYYKKTFGLDLTGEIK